MWIGGRKRKVLNQIGERRQLAPVFVHISEREGGGRKREGEREGKRAGREVARGR